MDECPQREAIPSEIETGVLGHWSHFVVSVRMFCYFPLSFYIAKLSLPRSFNSECYKRKWVHKTEIRQERWHIKKAEKL